MPFPMIDNQLLQRFHKGECNAEEIRLVQQWLEAEDDFSLSFQEDQLVDVENRIWNKIRPQGKSKNSINKFTVSVGIAATVMLFLYLFSYTGIESRSTEQSYSLARLKSRSLKLQGLNFRLVGEGNATVFSKFGGRNGNMIFCGVVEISNNSNQDINYTLNYGCGVKELGQKKHFLLKKGKTYIAMLDHQNTDEVILMRKEHLIEFPDMMPTGVERI